MIYLIISQNKSYFDYFGHQITMKPNYHSLENMNNSNFENKSLFHLNIERGKQAGILTVNEETQRITYKANREFKANLKNPEEIVRASYFTELVLDYKYPQKRIDFEIATKPDKDRIDIMVY